MDSNLSVMKKILTVLLVLAVAGGGAFAQGWTFSGLVDGGLGITITDDDNQFGESSSVVPVSTASTDGMRTQMDANFVSDDANMGLSFRVRVDGWGTAGAGGLGQGAGFSHAFGWLSFAENMVRVYGGRLDAIGRLAAGNTLDRMTDGVSNGWGAGLFTIIEPVQNLQFGLGAMTAGEAVLTGTHTSTNPHAMGSFFVSYLEPDLFRVTAGIRNQSNVEAVSQAYFSFSYLGLADMHIAATARFRNLEEFGDEGIISFYASFGHTGLVDGLDLRLGAAIGLHQDSDADPWMWFTAGVNYTLTDTIVPRLHLHYVSGGVWGGFNWNTLALTASGRLHTNALRDGATFFDDHQFFQIRPSVQIRITGASFVELGCVFHMNIGDAQTWRSGDNMDMLLYALVRVAF